MQRDPIGYWDNINIYAYVKNDPINWFDPFGLGRFGYRPLDGLPWIKPDKRSGNGNPQDRRNREIYHEQYWGKNWNIGYGPQGTFSEEEKDRGKYTMHGPEYDDDIMEQAFNNIKDNPENLGDEFCTFGIGHNNCQDFADRLRGEYDRIKQQQDERERKQREQQNQQCEGSR